MPAVAKYTQVVEATTHPTRNQAGGLAAALVRLSHLVQYVYIDVGRLHGLTAQQTQLLCQLGAGPVGMADLGRSLHLEKSSLTGLVDRVERRGLVTRIRDPHDRRAVHIALTGQGVQLAARTHEDVTTHVEALIGELPTADRQQLTPLLDNIFARHAAKTGCGRGL